MGNLPRELAMERDTIRDLARSYGLDFFDVVFEMVDFDELNMIASYGGFPTRYPHWRFGMEYEQLSTSYTYGLSKIYELVINNDPCYAYLMRANSFTEQKLVMAHVYGHADFFKHNAWFSKTSRKMMDVLANHGARIRRAMDLHGVEQVENFIDVVMSIDNLIDPYAPFIDRGSYRPEPSADDGELPRMQAKGYMDRYINPPEWLAKEQQRRVEERVQQSQFPTKPVRDVLYFLLENAPLQSWQQDILAMLREEAYYFAPQGMTKIMNEGWAVYWHSKLMTEHVLQAAEVVDYCETHAGTLSTSPGQLNPYKLGVELFRDIEDRWNKGRFGPEWMRCEDPDERSRWNRPTDLGRKKIFEVRSIYNDVSFVDEFITPEFAEAQKLFVYGRDQASGEVVIVDRNFEPVKQQLLSALTNFGNPIIRVLDANFENRGELLLDHQWAGVDLQFDAAMMTLASVHAIWQRPVHLRTAEGGKRKMLTVSAEGSETRDLPDEGELIGLGTSKGQQKDAD